MVALLIVALLGVGCGLIASGEETTTPLPTERVTGDPPISASFEVQPEGTTPPDVAITALDVTVVSDLPVPALTQCDGLWVDMHLRSGRILRYPPCAMPAEIAELRDSALRMVTAG
jgi:hypothetical protein